ncbi:MAG: D-amino-acid transaminase [Pseudohongiellaceae bacterium]
MSQIVYVNGEFVPDQEARVSVFDRGFLFGDGVYEVIPVINGRLVDREHALSRLERSLGEIDMDWPCSRDEYIGIQESLIERNGVREGIVYSQVTRGAAPRDFAYPEDARPTLVAFANSKALIDNPAAETGVAVVSVPDLRWKRRDIKSVSMLAQCMAKQAAMSQNATEGWMLEDGLVTEGASSSAFIVSDGTIITRALSSSILPGIRRKVILEIAAAQQLELVERPFSLEEALQADEAFLSSASTLVLPVVSLDGQAIGDGRPGPVTRSLRDAYVRRLRAEAGE